MVVSPEEVLEAQASASGWNLVLYAAITIFHGMGTGSSLGYVGLVLPHHTNSSSSALVTRAAKIKQTKNLVSRHFGPQGLTGALKKWQLGPGKKPSE